MKWCETLLKHLTLISSKPFAFTIQKFWLVAWILWKKTLQQNSAMLRRVLVQLEKYFSPSYTSFNGKTGTLKIHFAQDATRFTPHCFRRDLRLELAWQTGLPLLSSSEGAVRWVFLTCKTLKISCWVRWPIWEMWCDLPKSFRCVQKLRWQNELHWIRYNFRLRRRNSYECAVSWQVVRMNQ